MAQLSIKDDHHPTWKLIVSKSPPARHIIQRTSEGNIDARLITSWRSCFGILGSPPQSCSSESDNRAIFVIQSWSAALRRGFVWQYFSCAFAVFLIFLAATVRVRFGVNHSLSLLLVLVAVVKFPFPLRDTQTFLVDGERVNEEQAGSSSRILVLSDWLNVLKDREREGNSIPANFPVPRFIAKLLSYCGGCCCCFW